MNPMKRAKYIYSQPTSKLARLCGPFSEPLRCPPCGSKKILANPELLLKLIDYSL
jgi:hypothetical protein